MVLVAALITSDCDRAEQPRPTPPQQPQVVAVPVIQPEPQIKVDRYKIVNPLPGAALNIMLLDSATGDTWVSCVDSKGITMWCVVEKGGEQLGGITDVYRKKKFIP